MILGKPPWDWTARPPSYQEFLAAGGIAVAGWRGSAVAADGAVRARIHHGDKGRRPPRAWQTQPCR